jgi:ATPase subunit of ABC transporter with duplicated ATPase domains
VLELDRGHAYPYEGNYSTYLETKQARLTVEGHKDAKRRRRLQQELEWVRSGAKARQAKSRSRLQRYEQMAAEAQRRRTVDLEEIQIPPGPRLGNLVIEARVLSKRYGDRVLFDGLSFSLPRNGIVGVVVPNGVGKTTLLRILVGQEQPGAGELRIGDTVRMSYVDQNREPIDPDRTAWEVVSEGHDFLTVGQVDVPSRAYLAAFGFKGPDQQKPARLFSGGERNRLNLALTLKQGGNLLLLDEPTNDLDVETPQLPGERAAELPRLRRDHRARSMVPGPGGHPHPGLGGHRRPPRTVVLVRGQLRGLREHQTRTSRR